MSHISWSIASSKHLGQWDNLVAASVNGTLFHQRRFLGYHGLRFKDQECFLVALQGSEPIALLPIAVISTESGLTAKSPYGGSYGGIVFLNLPTYSKSVQLIDALILWLNQNKITRCEFTLAPDLFHSHRFATPAFCCQERGFRLTSRDVESVVGLTPNRNIHQVITGNSRKNARKAEKCGVTINAQAELKCFWPLMEETFARHGVSPSHEYAQLEDLLCRCPKDIRLTVARLENKAVAGVAEFRINHRVNSSFYLCQNKLGSSVQALSLLIVHLLNKAQNEGCELYSFGTSTVHMQARPNIFQFKESFGSEGVFRETLKWFEGSTSA